MGVTMTIAVLGCGLLVIFGGLIGHSLSQQFLNHDIRRQAALRRDIGEQWRAIQAFRSARRAHHCPHCGASIDDGHQLGNAA